MQTWPTMIIIILKNRVCLILKLAEVIKAAIMTINIDVSDLIQTTLDNTEVGRSDDNNVLPVVVVVLRNEDKDLQTG